MKKSLALSVIASTMIMAGGTIAPVEPMVVEAAPVADTGSFGDALKNGKFIGNMRVFYFDRSYDDGDSDSKGIARKPNSSTFTAGGILKYESGSLKITKKTTTHESIRVIDESEEVKTMPTIEVECPKCGNNTAYWWLLQTRSGDEPPTQFYRCTKCGYTWRQYS